MSLTRTGRPQRARRRVVLFGADPYLTFLVRLNLPDADVVEAATAEQAVRVREADLIVADAAVVGGLAHRGRARVLAILDRDDASGCDVPVDGVLYRPFDPSEVYGAIRRALASAEPAAAARGPADVARRWLGMSRGLAVLVAAVVELAGAGLTPVRSAVVVGACSYAALRLVRHRTGKLGAFSDVAVATAVIGATGGITSNYLGFGLMAALEAGLTLGSGGGAALGGLVMLGCLPRVVPAVASGGVSPQQIVASLAVFPLTAFTGGLVARVGRLEGGERALLAKANRVLSSLYDIAGAMPGGLDARGVASAILAKARETMRAPAAVVLAGDAGVLGVAGSYGLAANVVPSPVDARELGPLASGGVHAFEAGRLPDVLAGMCAAHPQWLAAPVRHRGELLGVVLLASAGAGSGAAAQLQVLADEAAVALENARLFARVRELSVDEERRRLARELHDGLAQSLAHVHLELGFLARHANVPARAVRGEAERLARVVGRALDEVRSTIDGLGASVAHEGLAGSLGAHLRDLRGVGGPEIVFETAGAVRLEAEREQEIFRVAQEAVSNALRHANARRITVALRGTGSVVRLTVSDDGVGMGPRGVRSGLGLRAMRERARRLDGVLTVEPRPEGGTCVELIVDVAQPMLEAISS